MTRSRHSIFKWIASKLVNYTTVLSSGFQLGELVDEQAILATT